MPSCKCIFNIYVGMICIFMLRSDNIQKVLKYKEMLWKWKVLKSGHHKNKNKKSKLLSKKQRNLRKKDTNKQTEA